MSGTTRARSATSGCLSVSSPYLSPLTLALSDKIYNWCIAWDYLIYQSCEPNQRGDYCVVHLRGGKITEYSFKLDIPEEEDPASFVHLQYVDAIKSFFLANSNVIKVVLLDELKKNELVEIKEDKIRHISTECYLLHGLLVDEESEARKTVVTIMETKDNQLDFVLLQVDHSIDEDRDWYTMMQKREHVLRSYNYEWVVDPIIKVSYFVRNKSIIAATMRESKHIDIYYDAQMIDCPVEEFEDIELGSQFIFTKRHFQKEVKHGHGPNAEYS